MQIRPILTHIDVRQEVRNNGGQPQQLDPKVHDLPQDFVALKPISTKKIEHAKDPY